MTYAPTNWQNLPSTNTPLNATNLNKMETEMKKNDEAVIYREIELSELSIAAGATTYTTFTIPSVSGYTCIAVNHWYSSGASNAYCVMSATTGGYLTVYNGGSSAASPTIRLRAIYIKN